eukprot:CAMPEP_0118930312 /NCGR_PEP_ID=MMETSP1169-20130426/7043_1 /TAXON_ID=36882 /ORGANISM="Pyramimonas obovata, Strain CCMP722" /LENGTH=206 /DNA_ID=CAMNT_0006872643 /DNA_START=111 /DNA_END=731 /DNA_ORIENTATION=+
MGQNNSSMNAPAAKSQELELPKAKVVAKPVKGLLYAQLGIDSDSKQKNFRLSQKFALNSNTSLKVFGMFADGTDPRCRVQMVHKRNFKDIDARIKCRLRYDFSKGLLKSSIAAKKKINVNEFTSVNAKIEGTQRTTFGTETSISKAIETTGKIELSKKWLNATSTQDCRMRLGLDVLSQKLYMQMRENHVALEWDSAGGWNVLYDF